MATTPFYRSAFRINPAAPGGSRGAGSTPLARTVAAGPTGFGGLSSQPVGYTGSGWDYGGQSYAIPTNQSRTPGGATFAAPATAAAASPLSLNLTQAANRQVNQVLNPQLAAQAAQGRQQNAAIQGFAQALMGKLQPIAVQVGADYDQAIGQTGALANQAATFLQQANPTPQVQALLASAGAPAEQQAQIGGQLGQTFGGGAGVLSFLGGAVPGREMAADKAAAQTQAAQYPLLAALRGQQDLAGALGQQATARNKILATRGQLYSDARQQIIDNNMNRAKERHQEKADAATAIYHGQLLAQGRAKIKQAGQIAGAKLTQSGQIAKGKLKEADAKRLDTWSAGVAKANEVARYHDQTTKSRDFATKVRNRGITVAAQSSADATTARTVHNAATELQSSLDSINKKEHDDTMASLTEMGLTGIGPDGKPTPKFQAELDKIHTDAQKQRVAAAQGWAKIKETATHHKASEGIAQQNANTSAVRANTAAQTATSTAVDRAARLKLAQRHEAAYEQTVKFRTSAKRQGVTPGEYSTSMDKAGKDADLAYYGKVVKDPYGRIDPDRSTAGISYGTAMNRLVHRYGISQQDAANLLNDYYAPGERGRPGAKQPAPIRVKSKGSLGVQAVVRP